MYFYDSLTCIFMNPQNHISITTIFEWLSMAPKLHTTVDVEKTFARAETTKPDPVEKI